MKRILVITLTFVMLLMPISGCALLPNDVEKIKQNETEELSHSGYEMLVTMYQYTWDGWGISTKEIETCQLAYDIIDALNSMEEMGKTTEKISDDVLKTGGGDYPVERGTMWIEVGNKIYRLTPDLSQICLVETHFGKGKILKMTDALKTDINNAWNYAPYDYYTGTYSYADASIELYNVFSSNSSVQIRIIDIYVEAKESPRNKITIELISKVDQTTDVSLHCEKSSDNLADGDFKTVQLKKEVPLTVELTFGGWSSFPYWIYIAVDNTRVDICIDS